MHISCELGDWTVILPFLLATEAILHALKSKNTEETPEKALCPYTGRILDVMDITHQKYTPNNVWNIIADLYNRQIEGNVISMKVLPGKNKITKNFM